MDKSNGLIAATVGLFAMLTYIGLLFGFWLWLFKKSNECLKYNTTDVELDYTGFKKLSFKEKCAYLYVRMWIEIIAIFTMAICLAYAKNKESSDYKKADSEATKFSRMLWLGNRVGFLFILLFSIIGGVLVTFIIEKFR